MPTTWSVPPRVLADAVDLRELVRLGQVNDALSGKADAGHTHGLPAHAATHATGGGDALTAGDVGAVPTSQRGPVGGVNAQTLSAGTYNLDASTFLVRRYTLTGSIALNVPTLGADGQRITFWFGASGADRTVTFASGYEVSPLLPSRSIVVVSGTWEMVEVECRNGTWRLVQTDQLLFAPGDIGAASSIDARFLGGQVVARFRSTTGTPARVTATAQTSASKVAELSTPVTAGRLYRIEAMTALNSSTAGGTGITQLNYTTDGSTPTAASTRLVYNSVDSSPTAGLPVDAGLAGFLVPAASATLRVALSFCSVSGASVSLTVEASRPMEILVTDCGVDPGASGTRF